MLVIQSRPRGEISVALKEAEDDVSASDISEIDEEELVDQQFEQTQRLEKELRVRRTNLGSQSLVFRCLLQHFKNLKFVQMEYERAPTSLLCDYGSRALIAFCKAVEPGDSCIPKPLKYFSSYVSPFEIAKIPGHTRSPRACDWKLQSPRRPRKWTSRDTDPRTVGSLRVRFLCSYAYRGHLFCNEM